ncbi:MAG: hypothetical protein HQL40_09405 [Alphaproteobacteria bacterium]|nr:hypothetical protein [Alphaproteobacteria bacterium]
MGGDNPPQRGEGGGVRQVPDHGGKRRERLLGPFRANPGQGAPRLDRPPQAEIRAPRGQQVDIESGDEVVEIGRIKRTRRDITDGIDSPLEIAGSSQRHNQTDFGPLT